MGACFPNHAYLVCCVLSHRKSLPVSLFWNNIHISDPPAPQPFANCAPAPPEPGFQPQFRFFCRKNGHACNSAPKIFQPIFKTCLLHIWRPSSRSLLSFWARRRLSQLFSLCLRFYRNGSNFLVIGLKIFVQLWVDTSQASSAFPSAAPQDFWPTSPNAFQGLIASFWNFHDSHWKYFILLVIIFYQGLLHLTLSL